MRSASALPLVALLAGCGLDLASKHRCVVTDDCNPGRVCDDGTCADPSAVCGTAGCALYAVAPAIASTGDSIAIEGVFGAGTQVRFPGGVTVAPSSLSAHRALVTVPEAATAGELTVISDGQTSRPLAFRHVAFSLGIPASLARPEQLNLARTPPSLASPRARFAAVAGGSFVYAVGGEDDAGAPSATIERATVNADGTLSSFALLPDVALLEPRTGATAVLIDGTLTVLGGVDGSGATLASVEQATMGGDGDLGTFAALPAVALATARSDAAAVVVGHALYLIGGRDTAGAPLASVERGVIDASGAVGAFAPVAARLSSARAGAVAVVAGQTLYVAGGFGAAGALGSVERAALGDGGPTTFSTVAGLALQTPRGRAMAAQLGQWLYVIGGEDAGGTALDAIERVSLAPDDATPPAFEAVTPGLVSPRSAAGALRAGNFLHLIGGRGPDGAAASIEHLSIDGGAVLASFAHDVPTLDQPRQDFALVPLGPWLYLIGGLASFIPVGPVARAQVFPDGTIGSFNRNTLALVQPRHGFSTAVIGDSLYVIGGRAADNASLTTIERADIAPGGELQPFQIEPALTLVIPRAWQSNAVVGNYLYVMGGVVLDGLLTSIERSEIGADGRLGPFELAPQPLGAVRERGSAMVMGNELYFLAGGAVEGAALRSIEHLSFGADGTLQQLVVLSDNRWLLEGRVGPASLLIGGVFYVLSGRHDVTLTTIEGAAIGADGTLGLFTTRAATMAKARMDFASVVLGDWAYAIGGIADHQPFDDLERAPLSSGQN